MRELKFRAWHKEQQRMLTDEFMALSLLASLDIALNHVSDLEVMQFTGLLDTHGKDIYEGDIVKFVNHLNGKELLRQCKWDSNYPAFVFCHLGEQTSEDIGGWKFLTYLEQTKGTMEIIGNVWEHPELLQQH